AGYPGPADGAREGVVSGASEPHHGERTGGGGGARLHAELPEDSLEMLVDGSGAGRQDRRDLRVGLSLGDPGKNLRLTRREAEWGEVLRSRPGASLAQHEHALRVRRHQADDELSITTVDRERRPRRRRVPTATIQCPDVSGPGQ